VSGMLASLEKSPLLIAFFLIFQYSFIFLGPNRFLILIFIFIYCIDISIYQQIKDEDEERREGRR
jgi:hypothetical protein